jgi:hypothetical protein
MSNNINGINRKRLNQKLDKENKITKEEYEVIINMLFKNNKGK